RATRATGKQLLPCARRKRHRARLGAGIAVNHLVIDPAVGLLEAVAKAGVGLPAEDLFDEGVVGVAAVDALGGREVVVAFELDAADLLDDIDELIDADHFAGADIDWLDEVAPSEHLRALEAIGDIHEGAGPVPVA